MHKFEITAAGRYDHYSDFGDTSNPKVSARWLPLKNEAITFRGSYGTSFQAPPLGDLQGSVLSFIGVDVPAQSPGGFVYGNPGPQDQLDQGAFLLGNPQLRPQTSENWTLGTVLTPPGVLKHLTVSVDYYNIDVKGLIIQDPQFILQTFDPPGTPGKPAGDIDPLTGRPYIVVDTAGRVVQMDVPFQNLGGLRTDGIDFGLMYEFPTENVGKFTLNADFNYTLAWDQQRLPGSPFESHLGHDDTAQLFGALPVVKGLFGLTWDYRDFSFSAITHYTDGFIDDATGNMVPPVWTVDLQASYFWQKAHTKFTVGCQNVADQDLPKDYAPGATQGNLYARNLYDIRQRFLYVSADVRF
jgi:iron complex outermembrane receptor protein